MTKELRATERIFRVLSLFSGCGGLDLGLRGDFIYLGKKYNRNNFEIVFANDMIPEACATFQKFFGLVPICHDIRDILYKNKDIFPDCDVVTGGFPCQDFSMAGKRRGFDTERGLLYKSMKQVIELKHPFFFLAENVKGLMNLGNALKIIKSDFRKVSPPYVVTHYLFNAADYEVPQIRERIFIFGIRKDIYKKFGSFIIPKPVLTEEKWITAKMAIDDLLTINKDIPHQNQYSKARNYGPHAQGNKPIRPDRPSITIRAEHHGNIEFHYKEPRRLSLRECARLQSFPDNFEFVGSTSNIYKQIGNAVPPVLAWHLAKSIENYLNGKKSEDDISQWKENIGTQK